MDKFKMSEEFHEWLSQCPTNNWFRESITEEGVTYFFQNDNPENI